MNFIDVNTGRQTERQKIAIVRALPGLGDFLCCVPALRAIRKAYPTAQITFIGLPCVRELVERFSAYVDRWLEFPGFSNIPEVPYSPSRTAAFLEQVELFDLVLQMHGNGSCMNQFVRQFGAKSIAGFSPTPQAGFLVCPEHEPEVRRHLRLLELLNIPTCGEFLEFPISGSFAVPHPPYVCIHPGASLENKRWSAAYFSQVSEVLSNQGFQIVVTGTQAEIELNQQIPNTIDLTGKTNLDELATLLKQAQLLICNDTGVSHLADALNIKSIVIFSNSDLDRWSPLDRQLHRVVSQATPEIVLKEAFDLLNLELSYAA